MKTDSGKSLWSRLRGMAQRPSRNVSNASHAKDHLVLVGDNNDFEQNSPLDPGYKQRKIQVVGGRGSKLPMAEVRQFTGVYKGVKDNKKSWLDRRLDSVDLSENSFPTTVDRLLAKPVVVLAFILNRRLGNWFFEPLPPKKEFPKQAPPFVPDEPPSGRKAIVLNFPTRPSLPVATFNAPAAGHADVGAPPPQLQDGDAPNEEPRGP